MAEAASIRDGRFIAPALWRWQEERTIRTRGPNSGDLRLEGGHSMKFRTALFAASLLAISVPVFAHHSWVRDTT